MILPSSNQLILLAFMLVVTKSASVSKSMQEVIVSLLSNDYDKISRPENDGNRVDVLVEVVIMEVDKFDEINHQVTVQLFLHQKWNDSRMAYDSSQVNGMESFTLDHEQSKKLWTPDTIIMGDRSIVKHEFSRPNEYTRIWNNGNVLKSQRITVTMGCTLNLRWYPFDQNICSLDIESYAYTANDLRYLWGRDENDKPIIIIGKGATQGVKQEITAFRGEDIAISTSTGNYSGAVLELFLKRKSFRYLLEVYFPCTVIPIVAFITLYVGEVDFRVLMSTICMFMMMTFAIISRLGMVTVEYMTALDIYVVNSVIMVFNVVLVNFFMHYLLKPDPASSKMCIRKLNNFSEENTRILMDEINIAIIGNSSSSTGLRLPNKSTKIVYQFIVKAYWTMPVLFVVFNIVYWIVVLIASSGTPKDFFIVEARNYGY